jgi:anti-sigma regulatory factor (Ser/Thr protein kinase)
VPVTNELEIRLSPSPVAPSAARQALELFGGAIDREAFESLQLLVSELVTNAVRHARLRPEDRIHLRVESRGDRLWVGVTDPGSGFTQWARTGRPDDPSGWGLFLVNELAERWGVERNDETLVWFEIRSPASPGVGNGRTHHH